MLAGVKVEEFGPHKMKYKSKKIVIQLLFLSKDSF